MRIGGHRMRDHIRLLTPYFGLIALVWILRLVLSAAGAPASLSRIASVSIAGVAALLLAVFRFHFRGFGGYASVVVAGFVLSLWTQLLIVAAIVFAVVTGIDNIFTVPEFSMPGEDPYHIRHIYGHLTFGLGIGIFASTAVGCLLLWLLRRFVPLSPAPPE